jgi:hypothetical protein
MESTANVLRKVRALIAQADDPAATPQEAEAYRDKAEALMFKYKIDLATAPEEERRQAGNFKPEWRTVDVCAYSNPWSGYYSGIALAIVRHVDARATGIRNPETGLYAVHIVGFPVDLDYFEMLLASAVLAFGKRMEPKVDPSLPEHTNAFNLRMGGMERNRIADALWGRLPETTPLKERKRTSEGEWVWQATNEVKARGRKVTALIKKGAEEAGEDPKAILGQGNSIKTFRESYASGFYSTLISRLRTMALHRGETDKGLVLASLEEQVEEMFFAEYPNLRPSESGRAEYVDPRKDCVKCPKTKSGYCREHQYLKPSTGRGRPGSFNYEAYSKGGHAARTVDLGPGGTPKAEGGTTRTQLG